MPVKIKKQSKTVTTTSSKKRVSSRKQSTLQSPAKDSKGRRAPVVTLMGHVDHGKTTLLDTIRKSKLVDKEHGGITQHIGAYQVEHQGRKITFIDTPGHAAFAKMRSQGAQVTDIVVLVVAANDGVKPQTREALSHIRAAKAPFLVAINKIDLPEANIERVKGQLAEEDVVVESYGGDIVSVAISAKTGENADQLLEMILLVSDFSDLSADPNAPLEAVVIETKQDRQKGVLTSLIVKNGSLRIGDEIKINSTRIKIKALNAADGRSLREAGPSTPVEVLGFKTPPAVGQVLGKIIEEKPAAKPEAQKSIPIPKPSLTKKEAEAGEEEKRQEEEEKQTIEIVLRTDVAGTLEAITSNLSEEVEIVGSGVGEVSESDVLLAQATSATIYAFNTKILKSAKRLAELEKVPIKSYNIIYKLFEDLEKRVLKILEPTIDEEVVGEAQIVAEFRIRTEHIAGCKVTSGEIEKNLPVHIKRGEEVIGNVKIKSLRRGKEDILLAKAKSECGIAFKPQIDFKVGDMVISYRKIEES